MSDDGTGLIRSIAAARSAAAEGLTQVLTRARRGEDLSERDLCAAWLDAMAAHDDLLSEGWYQPPPGGLAVLIGSPPSFERLAYDSLRDQASWPSDRVGGRDALIYAYASPVHRLTALLGDLGVTLYAGRDPRICNYLQQCLEITLDTANKAEVGMPLRELYRFAEERIRSSGYRNQTPSTTDPTSMNIGHTIPWSYPSGLRGPALDDPLELREQLKRGRVFLNGATTQMILPDIAFTVEPRLVSDDLPLCGYHVIVAFEDGKRTVLTDFDPLFQLFGMDYMQ